MNITDEEILNIEIYHDNKKNINLVKECEYFYDTINNKIIKIKNNYKGDNFEISYCEDIIKKIIYNNIITHNKNELTDVSIKFELLSQDNFLFIFDNGSLHNTYLSLINSMFSMTITKNVFVPFIYICEASILGNNSMQHIINTIKQIQDKHFYTTYIFETFLTTETQLKDIYKTECQQIGSIYEDGYIITINYNFILDIYDIILKKTEEIKTKKEINKLTELTKTEKEKMSNFIKEIKKVKIYLDKTEKNDFYNTILKELHEKITENYTSLTYKPIYFLIFENGIKLYIELSRIIISFKEARDTFYIKEINQFIMNKTYEPIYITTDQISNVRCTLNKISSINICKGEPRYIMLFQDEYMHFKKINPYYKYTSDEQIINGISNYNMNMVLYDFIPLQKT